MKHLKRFGIASMLIILLSASTLAGIIEMPAPAPPPPDPPSTTAPGDIYIPGEIHLPASSLSAGDLIMLDLLQNLLIVF